jgi:hypothetical protein
MCEFQQLREFRRLLHAILENITPRVRKYGKTFWKSQIEQREDLRLVYIWSSTDIPKAG